MNIVEYILRSAESMSTTETLIALLGLILLALSMFQGPSEIEWLVKLQLPMAVASILLVGKPTWMTEERKQA